jgi:hypothetical protein
VLCRMVSKGGFPQVAVADLASFGNVTLGVTPRSYSGYNQVVVMRSHAYISLLGACWIEGRACPRRYLSVLPSHVRANLFGSD